MQLFVLGMHRSGTSMVSRLLNLLGFNLGEEAELMQPRVDNPAGFWERRDVYELNEDILQAVDSSWDTACGDEIDALPPSMRAEFSRRAADILEIMSPSTQWAMKDPRFCITFPLWRGLLTHPVIVFVYRDPSQIAASLETRNGLPRMLGISLCESYFLSFMKHTDGLHRIVIRHDALMRDPYQITARLARQLGKISSSELRLPARKEVEDFIDEGLFRAREKMPTISEYLNQQRIRLFEDLEAGRFSPHWKESRLSRDSKEALKLFRDFQDLIHQNTELERQALLHRQRAELSGQHLHEVRALLSRGMENVFGELKHVNQHLDQLAGNSARTTASLAEHNRVLEQQLTEVQAGIRKWKELAEQHGQELDRIHHSKFWRLWMMYLDLRLRILRPFSSMRENGAKKSKGVLSG